MFFYIYGVDVSADIHHTAIISFVTYACMALEDRAKQTDTTQFLAMQP